MDKFTATLLIYRVGFGDFQDDAGKQIRFAKAHGLAEFSDDPGRFGLQPVEYSVVDPVTGDASAHIAADLQGALLDGKVDSGPVKVDCYVMLRTVAKRASISICGLKLPAKPVSTPPKPPGAA